MRFDEVIATVVQGAQEILADDGGADRRSLTHADTGERPDAQIGDRQFLLSVALQPHRRPVMGCARQRAELLFEARYNNGPGVSARLGLDTERLTQYLPRLHQIHADIDRVQVTPVGVAPGDGQVRSGLSIVVDYRSTADLELNVR